MNELFVVGASHKTAGLAVRERLALLDGQIEGFLQSLDVTAIWLNPICSNPISPPSSTATCTSRSSARTRVSASRTASIGSATERAAA